ncbi:hypothetical protein [Halpernia sp.]|uniref:hypothetical protein n=1 Tax=Halpernia sp. TaxID=2782209 RepID=UPI003A902BF9
MIFALQDNDFGFDGLFGFFVIQPFFAIIISALSIFICFILGLPIRLNKKINSWWISHFYITIIGIFIGVLLLIISFFPLFRESVFVNINDSEVLKVTPNLTFVCIGWFLVTFSVLHTFPPKQLTNLIVSFSQNILKKFMNS